MGWLDRFRKKEQREKTDEKGAKPLTDLEQLCGDDKETYQALINTMFLDPRKIGASMKEAVDNAKRFEKADDSLSAKTWYEIAGGLAIYEGNVKKAVEFYSICEKLSPDKKYLILKNPEKAVAKAQEYYQKHLKP